MEPDFIDDCIETLIEQNYSENELALRELFVAEYLIDFDSYGAAIRVGFNGGQIAQQYSKAFMSEPYVRKRIREQMDRLSADDKSLRQTYQNRIIQGLLREAHYNGPGASHSARVSAFAKLASIVGLDQMSDPKVNGVAAQGGVMEVPHIPGIDAWEQAASTAQAKLKQTVRE